MKIINIPTRVYAMGDRVLTPGCWRDARGCNATVVHDELEDFNTEGDLGQRADQVFMQSTIIVRLDDHMMPPGTPATELEAYMSRSQVTFIE